jgi:hypothetical protein
MYEHALCLILRNKGSTPGHVSWRFFRNFRAIMYTLYFLIFLLHGSLHLEIRLAFAFRRLLLHIANYSRVHSLDKSISI